ncbi:unnamed protein product [Polarella glacialis]|uniref:G8 domain-containing protein n=2 Tax=Polarella glacialis TaxID=89957 RepID=A0A813FIY3_POLGL|nr:unnamed protein product [Polarella glacialis]
MCRREFGPLVLTEEAPADGKYSPAQVGSTGPFAGPVWYNSLYWTNFPPLNCFDERQWAQHQDSDFFAGLSELNSDGRLAEQYVTFGAAREDLCQNARMPKASRVLKAEVMQYDGVRDLNWHFPLQSYIPKRGNHTPYEVQSRRFHDNGVINFGLNAEEFSDSVMPVSDLDACITTNDYTGYPGMGYFFTLLRIGGWPYRISKIGTFDGLGEGGRTELNIGMSGYGEQVLWQLLEGGPTHAPTGSEGQMEIQGCQRTGCRYWCQLYDLDWLGPKKDESLAYDPEIPPEKGYVWFRVVDSTVLPSTGKKAVRIQLLEDGIVPAWMDLHFLQARGTCGTTLLQHGAHLGQLRRDSATLARQSVSVAQLANQPLHRPGGGHLGRGIWRKSKQCTLEWDRDQSGLELRTGYVLVESGGHLQIGTEESPMEQEATVYITKGPEEHEWLGKRFLGGLGTGRIDIHGRRSPPPRDESGVENSAAEVAEVGGLVHHDWLAASEQPATQRVRFFGRLGDRAATIAASSHRPSGAELAALRRDTSAALRPGFRTRLPELGSLSRSCFVLCDQRRWCFTRNLRAQPGLGRGSGEEGQGWMCFLNIRSGSFCTADPGKERRCRLPARPSRRVDGAGGTARAPCETGQAGQGGSRRPSRCLQPRREALFDGGVAENPEGDCSWASPRGGSAAGRLGGPRGRRGSRALCSGAAGTAAMRCARPSAWLCCKAPPAPSAPRAPGQRGQRSFGTARCATSGRKLQRPGRGERWPGSAAASNGRDSYWEGSAEMRLLLLVLLLLLL